MGPLTLWDEAEAGLRWDAETKADLLDGLVHHVASPTGSDGMYIVNVVEWFAA